MFEHIPVTLAQSNDAPAPPPNVPQATNESQSTNVNGTETAPSTDPNAINNGAGGGSPGGIFGGMFPLVILLGFMVLLFVMTGRKQRQERKQRDAMLAAIKKGDRIQTVGGIRGTLVEVREDEVIVKVDENANTRLRFARNAIQNVLTDEPDKE